MNTTYFIGIHDYEALRKAYKKLAMKLHPDHGGTNEEFRAMAEEYHKLTAQLKDNKGAPVDEVKASAEAERFKKILDVLFQLDGLEIELCGNWLWISGNTYPNKDALKAAGCIWSRDKQKWYWRPDEYSRKRWHRGGGDGMDMEEIRTKYGSQKIQRGAQNRRLTA